MRTLHSRDDFRDIVFARDGHKCVVCKKPAIDAHHIIERRLWPDGGYYIANGVSLCEEHHLAAEATTLSCEELRKLAGITVTLLPEHFYPDCQWDKWGNPFLPDGRRYRGELYYDENVKKILEGYDDERYFVKYVKYPRTYHLPWSPGGTSDDRRMLESDAGILFQQPFIVTIKMDGENTNMYRDHIHARSIDGRGGPERDWVKNLHSKIAHDIPEGWRICGENLYGVHSIRYRNLRSYFYVFSIWNEKNECLSWDDTVEWCSLLDLDLVPVVDRSVGDNCIQNRHEGIMKALALDITDEPKPDPEHEGYVIRSRDSFPLRDFRKKVGKWVRKNHVPEHGRHWKHGKLETNELSVTGLARMARS